MCRYQDACGAVVYKINCFINTPKSQEGINSCFQGKQEVAGKVIFFN
jgi:hypothetical protein